MTITANYKRNYYLNGVEIFFSSDPGIITKKKLINNNWRYHGKKKCWYIYYSVTNELFAQSICNSFSVSLKKNELKSSTKKDTSKPANSLPVKDTKLTEKKSSKKPIIPLSKPIGYYVAINPKDERYRRKRSLFS